MGATPISDLAFAFTLTQLQTLTLTVNGPVEVHCTHNKSQMQMLTVNGPLAMQWKPDNHQLFYLCDNDRLSAESLVLGPCSVVVSVQRYNTGDLGPIPGLSYRTKRVEMLGSVSISYSLTPPRYKIGSSPMWEDRERCLYEGDHQSHHLMAHLRGYSHQGWVSSQDWCQPAWEIEWPMILPPGDSPLERKLCVKPSVLLGANKFNLV